MHLQLQVNRAVLREMADGLFAPRKKRAQGSLSCLLVTDSSNGEMSDPSPVDHWKMFQQLLEKEVASMYFFEEAINIDCNPLAWLHNSSFLTFSSLARRYLAVPCTSVPSEVLFSAVGLKY